jgi:hypothetical protein
MKENVNKTNIMVFGFGKLRQNLKFTYKKVDIEIVKQFNYLGVIFTNPQTSQPYKRICFIILSKRTSWIFTDNLYNLPILRTSYIALSALSARCFLGTSELHVFVKITPK